MRRHLNRLVDSHNRLRISEERLRVGLRAANTTVFAQDTNLRYVWIYQAQPGYSTEQVIGHTDAELLPIEPANRVTELKRQVLEDGIKRHAEISIDSGDQTFVYELFVEPLRDKTGVINGLTGASLDITERKQGEEELRHKQAMLARTEGIAHIGSWEWYVATDTVKWSEELFRIFQRDPADGAPSFAEHNKFYQPEDFDRLKNAVKLAISDGTPYEIELRAIRNDGETRVCLARGYPERGRTTQSSSSSDHWKTSPTASGL